MTHIKRVKNYGEIVLHNAYEISIIVKECSYKKEVIDTIGRKTEGPQFNICTSAVLVTDRII